MDGWGGAMSASCSVGPRSTC